MLQILITTFTHNNKLQHALAFPRRSGRALLRRVLPGLLRRCWRAAREAGALCQADNTHSLLRSKNI